MQNPPLPPDRRTYILEHRVTVNPARWSSDLALVGLWDYPPFAEFQNVASISRERLFEVATTLDLREDVLMLNLLSTMWGCGTSGVLQYRCMRAYKESRRPVAEIADTLLEAVNVLRTAGSVVAYDYLRGAVPFFGPAFFTKFLYFAGYHDYEMNLAPLILDNRVRLSLNHFLHQNFGDTGWSAKEYETYLWLAQDLARHWGMETGQEVQPDVIERVLFDASGKPDYRGEGYEMLRHWRDHGVN